MERIGKLASRYARALLRSLREQPTDVLEQTAHELELFSAAWVKLGRAREFFLNPGVETKDRATVLGNALAKIDFSLRTKRFIELIFNRNRLDLICQISAGFRHLVNELNSVVDVRITTATSVTPSEQEEIRIALNRKLVGKPVYSFQIDSNILGGVVIEYAGNIVDGSLKHQLERLQRELLS